MLLFFISTKCQFIPQVRVQCFHYLKANAADKFKSSSVNKSDSMEPDIKVLKLTKVLSEMEEALIATLHPRKTKVSRRFSEYFFFLLISHIFPCTVYLWRIGPFGGSHSYQRLQLHGVHQSSGRPANVQKCVGSKTNAGQHNVVPWNCTWSRDKFLWNALQRSTRNPNVDHWTWRTLHGIAVFECVAIVVQVKSSVWFECVGLVSAAVVRYFGHKTTTSIAFSNEMKIFICLWAKTSPLFCQDVRAYWVDK